jgi:ubiquinone/menaquinone biosynthesis C-methylase UbiE
MTKSAIIRVFQDFAGAMHSVNSNYGSRGLSEVDKDHLKKKIVAVYDYTTATLGNSRAWNWGFHDESVRKYITDRIPSIADFNSDGFSEQLYCFTFMQIPPEVRSAGRILEVGCGTGTGLNFLSRLEPEARFVGLDLSQPTIAVANSRFSRLDRLRFVQGDAENLPFENGEFDAVICVESAHNYPDFPRFLAEVHRVLKPRGRLSLVDLFTHDRRRLTAKSLAEMHEFEVLAMTDISEQVRAAVRQRMSKGSLFRTTARNDFRSLRGLLNERAQMMLHGSLFVGIHPLPVLRTLRRTFGKAPSQGFDIDSYHHYMAERKI